MKCPKCDYELELVDVKRDIYKCRNPWCQFEIGEKYTFGIDPEYLKRAKAIAAGKDGEDGRG